MSFFLEVTIYYSSAAFSSKWGYQKRAWLLKIQRQLDGFPDSDADEGRKFLGQSN